MSQIHEKQGIIEYNLYISSNSNSKEQCDKQCADEVYDCIQECDSEDTSCISVCLRGEAQCVEDCLNGSQVKDAVLRTSLSLALVLFTITLF